MRVTMMLCDSAQVADGKLYILGGGWSVTGPGAMPSALAMKIDVDWTGAGFPHKWELLLVDEDGRPVMVDTPDAGRQPMKVGGEIRVERPPGLREGSPIDVALAVNFGPLPLEPNGRFSWFLTIDNETQPEWQVSFSTRPVPPPAVEP